jgi:pantetheine-phosphate adenylyltransferase
MKTAIYAGTFDPITNGHMWMIDQASNIFDKILVAVAYNPDKKTMFSVDEREKMIHDAIKYFEIPNVSVVKAPSNKLLVDFAKEKQVDCLLRGIRESSDFEYEKQLRLINEALDSTVTTVFLMPPANLSIVSSSMVKSLLKFESSKDVLSNYVPPNVLAMLLSIS